MDTAQIVWGMLFGAIGAGYMVYGKRQRAIVPLACGLALMLFPYVVSNNWGIVITGVVLMAIPYFVRL